MMRSLFSGVAGLKTHQTKMDVIGNNIANVNTVAYKSQSVTFQDLMYQTTQSASGATDSGRAGVNAKQIGLGVSTGSISTSIATSGASQSTGNPFDVQISGDSFFVVSDGSSNYFTRAGAFYVDGNGTLAMSSNGYTVMGWQPSTEPGKEDTIVKDNVTALQIMSADNLSANPEQTKKAYLSGILDKNSPQLASSEGLIVNFSVYDNLGYSYTVKATIKSTGTDGAYSIVPTKILDGQGEDVIKNDCIAQAKGATTGTFDSKIKVKIGNVEVSGSYDAATGQFSTKYNPAGAANTIYYDTENGAYLGFRDSTGSPTDLNKYSILGLNVSGIDGFSELTEANQKDAEGKDIGGGNHVDIVLDTTTCYDNKGTSSIKGTAGDYNGQLAGRKVGKMSGVAIQTDGKIYGSYDNGTTKLLGQIAVANFANASGLQKEGENLYSATLNSGQFDGIGEDITAGAGSFSTGVLEMSNVDLSAEFTDMITTQRGFQANSRIITVSDSMLEELTNLKR